MSSRDAIVGGLQDKALNAAVEKGEITAEQAKQLRSERALIAKKKREEERRIAAEARARTALRMEEKRKEGAQREEALAEYQRKMVGVVVLEKTDPARYCWRYHVGPWPVDPDESCVNGRERLHHSRAWGCFAFGCCQAVSGEYEPLCINVLNAATCVLNPLINAFGCIIHNCDCHM